MAHQATPCCSQKEKDLPRSSSEGGYARLEGTQPAKIRPQGGAGGGDKTELIVGVVSPVLVCSASWRSRGELCMLHPKGTRIIQFPVSGSGPWVPSRQPCSKAHQLAGQPPCGQPRAVAFSAVPPAPAARALTPTPPSCASLKDLPQGWCGQTTESKSPLELKAGGPIPDLLTQSWGETREPAA